MSAEVSDATYDGIDMDAYSTVATPCTAVLAHYRQAVREKAAKRVLAARANGLTKQCVKTEAIIAVTA